MTYHIATQEQWEACLDVVQPGDYVNPAPGVTIHGSNLQGIRFIPQGGAWWRTYHLFNLQNYYGSVQPKPKRVYLVSPVFCQEIPV